MAPPDFRARRLALGLSVRGLATALEISAGHVSLLENGKRPIRRVYWLALAQLEEMAKRGDPLAPALQDLADDRP